MRIEKFLQPLDQFDIFLISLRFFSSKLEILNYFKINIIDNLLIYYLLNLNFNNVFLYMLIILIWLIFMNCYLLMNRLSLIFKSLWQYIYEIFFYKFSLNIIMVQVGKIGQSYFIYITAIFFYILLSNFLGLIPNSFTITSHIILTFMFGFSILVGLTLLGFMKQKLGFIQLFIPKGVPIFLLPLLVLIEIVSFIARGFSLSIRLFANLMSGHSLIHILLFFIIKIIKFHFSIGLLGLSLILVIFALEIGISFLQAYVFMVLVSIYFKDSFYINH